MIDQLRPQIKGEGVSSVTQLNEITRIATKFKDETGELRLGDLVGPVAFVRELMDRATALLVENAKLKLEPRPDDYPNLVALTEAASLGGSANGRG